MRFRLTDYDDVYESFHTVQTNKRDVTMMRSSLLDKIRKRSLDLHKTNIRLNVTRMNDADTSPRPLGEDDSGPAVPIRDMITGEVWEKVESQRPRPAKEEKRKKKEGR